MTTPAVLDRKGFPQADRGTSTPTVATPATRSIGIGEPRGYPKNGLACQEWIPGVTGPYGWYDPQALAALDEERIAHVEKVAGIAVNSIYTVGAALCVGWLSWVTLNIVIPVLS